MSVSAGLERAIGLLDPARRRISGLAQFVGARRTPA